MISRFENRGFFAEHYDWIALGVGLLALAGAVAFYLLALSDVPEEMAAASVAEVDRLKPSEIKVNEIDMTAMERASRFARSPFTIADASDRAESFLASERRIHCKKCKKAIAGDKANCPFCGEKQEEPKKVVVDADGDGLPDEWERKYGLNPNDASDANADADGDGFTNLEEYQAKTDPTNAKDHPDYLDSLKIVLPLKETYMPFVFTKAMKIPTGWRCEFFDVTKQDDYGRRGRAITATINEEVGKSGYVLKNYEAKETKSAIKGGQGLKRRVDVSEATLTRKSDGKTVKLVISGSKLDKPAPVDVQATLAYERGTVKNFEVVKGAEIDLNGTKYRIADIKAVGKSAKITVEALTTGMKRTLEAIEQ